jgi:hypothetical protein
MYNPALGTFINLDPLESGSNLYAYCGDAPTGATDPSGLEDHPAVPSGSGSAPAQPSYTPLQQLVLEIFAEPNNVGFAQKPGVVRTNGDWTAKQLVDNVFTTLEGGALYQAARKAAGRDPYILVHPQLVGGACLHEKKLIMLPSTFDLPTATQAFLVELSNMSRKDDFDKIDKTNRQGGYKTADEYGNAIENIEFEGIQKVIAIYDKSKQKWGATTCRYEYARGLDFKAYLQLERVQKHRKLYLDNWIRPNAG